MSLLKCLGLVFGSSSIGKKARMAITGLLLCGFLVVHLSGNLLLFKPDGGEAYNNYAKFLHSGEMEALIVVAEIGLLALFLLHLVLAFVTGAENTKARSVGYAMKQSKQGHAILAAPAHNVMMATGVVVLLFILLHLADFRFRLREPSVENQLAAGSTATVAHADGSAGATAGKHEGHKPITRNDAIALLRDPVTGVVYLVGCLVLGYHLVHGFGSAFQTLGFNHPRYNGTIRMLSILFALIVAVGFGIFPIWAHLTKLPGDKPSAISAH